MSRIGKLPINLPAGVEVKIDDKQAKKYFAKIFLDDAKYHAIETYDKQLGFDKIAASVTKPFTGKKIGAYYGCLLLRPGKIMQMDNAENPKIIEDFINLNTLKFLSLFVKSIISAAAVDA